VIDAVRALDTKVMRTLKDDVREPSAPSSRTGLRDGEVAETAIAASVRDVIGLAPNRRRRSQLPDDARGGRPRRAARALRDKRFDATLDRLLGGDGLSPAQVDRMVDAYRRKMLAFNAETNARTAALDSMKLGQKLSIDEAVRMQVYDASRLIKRWIGVMDDRERPEHVAMEKEEVPYEDPYSNGEDDTRRIDLQLPLRLGLTSSGRAPRTPRQSSAVNMSRMLHARVANPLCTQRGH
jgi:hypothetical protein